MHIYSIFGGGNIAHKRSYNTAINLLLCYHSSFITKRVGVAYMQNKYCRLLHAAGRNKIHTLYICVCTPCMQLDIQENQPPNKVEFLCFVSMPTHNLITNYTPYLCILGSYYTIYQQQIIQHIHTCILFNTKTKPNKSGYTI